MSKLVVASYQVSDAERRYVQRKIALIRAMLKRCAKLRDELKALEPVSGESWGETLAKYKLFEKTDVWQFTEEHNRLEESLPQIMADLEKALADARAKRTRLELTAATLLALGATAEEKALLAPLETQSATLYADRYADAWGKVEAMLQKRLDTPLTDSGEAKATAEQLAMAQELLPPSDSTRVSDVVRPAAAEPSPDALRIRKLTDQIAAIDPVLGTFDDLIQRLRTASTAAGHLRPLLIASVELDAQERLGVARRRQEVREVMDEALSWLAPFSSLTADDQRRRLDEAAQKDDVTTARLLRDEVKAWAEAEAKREDGVKVRAALVAELQNLGYEVKVQGGGWTEGSRITALRPSEPNYDVELSAAPGGVVQSKVRAYAHAGRSTGVNRRDVEVEQGWCDDLAKLNKQLAECGIEGKILREDRPGSIAQEPLEGRAQTDFESRKPQQQSVKS